MKKKEALGASQKRVSAELAAMIRLHKLSTLSVTQGDLGIILCEIVDAAIDVADSDFGTIQLVDPVSSALRIVAQRGFPQWWIDFWNDAPEGQGSCGLSLQRGERVIVEDVEQIPIFASAALEMQLKVGVRAVQSTPLVSRSGKPLGVFSTHYRKPQRPDENKLRVLDLLARQAADIIEHVQAIAMLRESEERFRNMADGVPLVMWVSDPEGNARFINRAYMDFFGITLEDLKSRGWQSLIHPDDVAAYVAEVTACLRDRRFLHAEGRVKRRDGEWRWVESFGQPCVSSTGKFLGIAGSSPDITERKLLEESLRESEERLRLAMSSGNIGFWDFDVKSGRITWSRELEDIYGLDHAGSYEAFSSRVHPDDLAAIESEQDAAVRNHKPFETEFRVILPSGEIRWLCSRGRGHYDENGRVVRVVGININITERIQAEEALRQREQRLRLALDASRAGSWMWDARTGRVDWDDRFREIYGFSAGDLASFEAWLSRVHEEDRPKVFKLWNQILHTKTQDTFDITFRIVRPDGTVLWIQSFGRVHRDADGQVIRLSGLELDVTDRRRAEEALRESKERDAFLLLLADTLRPLCDPLDMQEVAARLLGEHLRVNRAGYAEIEGDQYIIRREYVNGVGPLAGSGPTSTFGAGMREVYRRGEPVAVNDVSTDPRFSDRDRALYLGKQIAALVGVMLLKDGRLVAAFGVNTSTSRVWTPMEVQLIREVAERTWAAVERAHAEAELRKAHDTLERRVRDRTAELEARNAQLRRLASQLTLTEQNVREQLAKTLHDGLQQLLFIAGITLNRAVKSTSQADQVGLLQNARANVNEAMEAVRTLSVDLFPPVLHTGGLPAALDWLARRTQAQYGVVVDVTADARANPEASDVRILLFEAVRELLFNAIKHAHADRVDINLAVRPGDIIHIDVSDEGVGFDPAVTRHHNDQHQVGLGLFSIQERFALLGGQLHIQSAPGKGARFTLTLPRTSLPHLATDGAEARYDSGLRERLVYASAGGTSKSLMRILVADDHVVARAGLRELFSERPELQVVGEAANGVEAISQATALQPDIIVMDVSMPQMNGIEATRQIHRTLPHIRIVGLSTYDDEDTKRSMREAGAEAYFTKNEATDRLLDHLLSIHPTVKGAVRS